MKAHTLGCLIFLALIKRFSFGTNPFHVQNKTLKATEGSCIEIRCEVTQTLKQKEKLGFWIKDPVWADKDFGGTVIYSSNSTKCPVSPHFTNRVKYVGSPFESWENIHLKPSCSILICNLNKNDSGNYTFRFVGEKDYRVAIQPFINLSVTENPCLLTFEKPKVVMENDNITLTCSTLNTCPSEPKIEEKFTPSLLHKTKSESLKRTTWSFKATWEDDGRSFSCQTQDNNDTYLIQNVSLTVQYAPINISAKSSSEIVREGKSVTLTCSAKGQPNPSFMWIRNDQVVIQKANWTISSINYSQNGSYYCYANNTRGVVTSELVTINVTYPPVVDIYILKEHNGRNEIRQGDKINFTCNVKRSNPPPTLSWLKNGTQVRSEPTYVFESIKPEDSGTYTCSARNTEGHGSKDYQLRVHYRPRNTRIDGAPTKSVKINLSLDVTCNTDAYPTDLSYTWYRSINADKSQWMLIEHQKTLKLQNVQRADEAFYRCNASNSIDKGDISEPVYIEVLFRPNRTKLAIPAEVTEGHSIIINCTTESFPPASFTLARPSMSKSNTPQLIHSTVINNNNKNTLRYSINNVTSDDAGFYTCSAKNSEGEQISPEKQLVVKYTPKDVKVESHAGFDVIENSSLRLNCNAKAYPSVDSFTWIKMTNGKNEIFNSTEKTLIIKSVSLSDSGLYSCKAKNKIGTGESQQVEVKIKYAPKHTKIIKGEMEQRPDGSYFMILSCSSLCYPPVSEYEWLMKTKDKYTSVASNQNFTLESTKPGEVYCIAKNEIGQSSSEAIKPFHNTVMTIITSFLWLCIILFIFFIIFSLYRNELIQQGTRTILSWSGCLGWWNEARRSNGSETGLAEPFRSRDDLLPDQPCRPNAQRCQTHPDSTPASNSSTVYVTVNLPKGKQAPSTQQPTRQRGGHVENDSLNYASLHFVNKQKKQEEDAEYSVVSKPRKSKEEEQERLEDYENISTAHAVKPPFPYDFDTDTDTSEEEVEVNYSQVNFKPKQRHQTAKRDSSSTEDETQYSEVKI